VNSTVGECFGGRLDGRHVEGAQDRAFPSTDEHSARKQGTRIGRTLRRGGNNNKYFWPTLELPFHVF
jgi:hypothetical protein